MLKKKKLSYTLLAILIINLTCFYGVYLHGNWMLFSLFTNLFFLRSKSTTVVCPDCARIMQVFHENQKRLTRINLLKLLITILTCISVIILMHYYFLFIILILAVVFSYMETQKFNYRVKCKSCSGEFNSSENTLGGEFHIDY
jgi:hypothetical protein